MTLTGGDGASMSKLAELGPRGFGNLLTPILGSSLFCLVVSMLKVLLIQFLKLLTINLIFFIFISKVCRSTVLNQTVTVTPIHSE